MRLLDPHGFGKRYPNARTIRRSPLTSAGPNEEWCGDGWDKLKSLGFHVYGFRDKFSRYYLDLRLVPNNRLKETIAHLFIDVVIKAQGVSSSLSISGESVCIADADSLKGYLFS